MKLKDEFLKTNKCLECDLILSGGSDKSDYTRFWKHIKEKHGMVNSEYYVKHFLKGVKPKCACGCGVEVIFFKGKFNKYYADHKNTIKPSNDTVINLKQVLKERNRVENLLKRVGLTANQLEESYYDFINLKKPMSMISDELFIDFRTVKGYWVKLGLIKDKESFKHFTLKSKSKWMSKPLKPKDNIIKHLNENVSIIKNYVKGKNKVTFDEIMILLNIKVNKNYLSWFLRENLNSTEIKKIKFIKISQIEVNFLNVLKFYFGNSVDGSFELDGKIFDYKVGKKILIELDGEYWHSKEDAIKNDKMKNQIAKEQGYELIRVSDSEVKHLDFLNKIKTKYNEFK